VTSVFRMNLVGFRLKNMFFILCVMFMFLVELNFSFHSDLVARPRVLGFAATLG
jgi:hypothetical protein